MAIVSEIELFKACHILFGTEADISYGFLEYVQPSGIKSAYRKLARTTHPDVAAVSDNADAERFMEANWAYESLLEFINKREHMPRRKTFHNTHADTARRRMPRRRRRRTETGSGKGHFYQGIMPEKKLMFGEFLFYSGHVSWETLVKAIVWQRGQRPKIGDLARKWGWIDRHGVLSVLRARKMGEQIGSTLIRLGICNRVQVNSLLLTQRKMQRPFGEFFITNGYLKRELVNNILYKQYKEHNSKY